MEPNDGPALLLDLRSRRTALATAAVFILTAAFFLLALSHPARSAGQRIDSWWLRQMMAVRTPVLTGIARAFNTLGLSYPALAIRVAVAAVLAVRRRWWGLAAFALAIALSWPLTEICKAAYARARPPGGLVAAGGFSFPSSHTVSAAVVAVSAVIVLAPAARRAWWLIVAAAFSAAMAVSRTYLGVHWLSDTLAGLLLGASCALAAAALVSTVQLVSVRRARGQGTGAAAVGDGT